MYSLLFSPVRIINIYKTRKPIWFPSPQFYYFNISAILSIVLCGIAIFFSNLYCDIEKCVTPPVEDWISAFMEAEMVVTDSFHGCVFSIIFNKPFWVIGNKARGMARFETLLSQYGLQDRLINPSEVGNIDVNKPINWDEVNNKRKELQDIAVDFIEKNLI